MRHFLLVADAPPQDGWSRLPDPRREDVDPERKDARFAKLDRAARLLALGAHRAGSVHPERGREAAESKDERRTGIVLASMTGCLAADERFDATRGRAEGASPALFPATLPTAPAAELSIRLGLLGPVLSVRAGVLGAWALAARAIARGEADFMLACGLEVAARGAAPLLGTSAVLHESVSVFVVDRAAAAALSVPWSAVLDPPRGPLLANEAAASLLETLNSRR